MQLNNGCAKFEARSIHKYQARKGQLLSLTHSSRATTLANLRAFLTYSTSPEAPMPDPLGFADVRWLVNRAPKGPPLTRLLEHQYLSNPSGVTWGMRKDDRSCREMTLVSWPAQLSIRLFLHEGAEGLVARQSSRSYSGRIELAEPRGSDVAVLTARPFGHLFGLWKHDIEHLARTDPPVVLKTDIKRFYPSVNPRVIEQTLLPILGPELSFGVRMVLERVQIDSGNAGLPVSAESSGWLANQLLHQVDLILEGIPGLASMRWSDDEFLVDGIPSLVNHAQSLRNQELRSLGICSSKEKTVRSWLSGQTGQQLLLSSNVSQGDITAASDGTSGNSPWFMLAKELTETPPNKSRLNRLFGILRQQPLHPGFGKTTIDWMIKDPPLWEGSCTRASGFLSRHASREQLVQMIFLACDLDSEGLITSDQVVSLLHATCDSKAQIPSEMRGHLTDQLLKLARRGSCIPVRIWARHVAYSLDPERVRGNTIDSGEFDGLHSYEQRVAIAYADPQRHRWWLQRQLDQGKWPTTAEWRLNSRR